jgi:uncharacterized HAD superfamily protein
MRYGIDIDGVLANFDIACSRAMRFGPEPLSDEVLAALEQPSEHWYHKRDLVGPANWEWFWTRAVTEVNVFGDAPPIGDELQHLAQLPGEVFLITARPAAAINQTYEWLGKHQVRANGVLHVARPEEKVEFIRCLGVGVYVDDHPETVPSLVGQVDAQLFMFTQPWNKGVDAPRISSLKELL